MKHTLVCVDCGEKRRSIKRPDSRYAPKTCRRCHLERNRRYLAKMMKRPYLPLLSRPR